MTEVPYTRKLLLHKWPGRGVLHCWPSGGKATTLPSLLFLSRAPPLDIGHSRFQRTTSTLFLANYSFLQMTHMVIHCNAWAENID